MESSRLIKSMEHLRTLGGLQMLASFFFADGGKSRSIMKKKSRLTFVAYCRLVLALGYTLNLATSTSTNLIRGQYQAQAHPRRMLLPQTPSLLSKTPDGYTILPALRIQPSTISQSCPCAGIYGDGGAHGG